MLAWCALSLIWTPFLAEASERLFNIAGTVLMAVAGYLALPERMRSANLYIQQYVIYWYGWYSLWI